MSDVFDPERDGISDAEWSSLVERASAGHFFSENQLFLAYARHKVKVRRYIALRGVIGLLMIPVGLAAWVYALNADWGITLVLGIVITLSGVAMVGTGVVTERSPAAREPIQRWLSRWIAERGLERLITGPSPASDRSNWIVGNPRAVIVVERDELVDLLASNGAHIELDALIVAESGYPAALAAATNRFLAEQPTGRVVALHDATTEGVAMPSRLAKNRVLALGGRALIDAGLFPADVIWIGELAPAIPASHTTTVPVDSLSYEALLTGLRGVLDGELSLHAALDKANF